MFRKLWKINVNNKGKYKYNMYGTVTLCKMLLNFFSDYRLLQIKCTHKLKKKVQKSNEK